MDQDTYLGKGNGDEGRKVLPFGQDDNEMMTSERREMIGIKNFRIPCNLVGAPGLEPGILRL